MAEPTVLFGTVPVFYICGYRNYHSGNKADCLLALFLIPAFSVYADQNLAAALPGMMDVPVIPAARLKGYVRNK